MLHWFESYLAVAVGYRLRYDYCSLQVGSRSRIVRVGQGGVDFIAVVLSNGSLGSTQAATQALNPQSPFLQTQ